MKTRRWFVPTVVCLLVAAAAGGVFCLTRPNYSKTSCLPWLRQVDPTAVSYGIRVGLEDEHGVQTVAVRADGSQVVRVGLLSPHGQCLNITFLSRYSPAGTPVDTEYYPYWTNGPALPPPVDTLPATGGAVVDATESDHVTIGVNDAVTLGGRTIRVAHGADWAVGVKYQDPSKRGIFWLTGYDFGFRVADDGGGGIWLQGADRVGQFQLIDLATNEVVLTLVVT